MRGQDAWQSSFAGQEISVRFSSVDHITYPACVKLLWRVAVRDFEDRVLVKASQQRGANTTARPSQLLLFPDCGHNHDLLAS
jgi:hypothetical protein